MLKIDTYFGLESILWKWIKSHHGALEQLWMMGNSHSISRDWHISFFYNYWIEGYCSTWLVESWQAYIISWPKKKFSLPRYLKLAYRNILLENLWQLANFYTYSIGKGYLVLPALYMKWMWISKMKVLNSATSVLSDWISFIAFDRFDSHQLWILWYILTLYMSLKHKPIHSAYTRNTLLPWLILQN